jgi:hypothetical protein
MTTGTSSSYAQPALIGGVAMGVLSALPLISAGNLCCCLWVVSGGLVAAYVLQQNQSTPISAADGALVGLLAGLVGAVVQVVVSIPITLMLGPMERALVQRAIEMAGSMPPDARDMFDRVSRVQSGAFFFVSRIFALMFWLCVGAVFSTIGGVVGATLFRKNLPPGTIDVIPTSTNP